MQNGGFTPFPLLYLFSLRMLYNKSELDAQDYVFLLWDSITTQLEMILCVGFQYLKWF
jgi:hypothetical protein